MKKIIILMIFIIIQIFPCLWIERPAWYWNGERWICQTLKPWARGRLWLYFKPVFDSCNKEHWEIPFTDSISVAQWIRWSIDGKKTLWRVRKIGTFAGIGPIICLKSNEDVAMSFQGFENPTNGETEIEKWYGFTDTTVEHPSEVSQWISASDLNNYTIRFDFPNSCQSQSIKIWEKIEVEQCDRACEYVDPDGATIILTLTVIKPWIDRRTGLFKSLPIEPPYIIDIEN
ncbi:MAG: hypothetical protein ABIK40_06705 [candidate division WOR-3 bacterium]|uniref:Uncharacterized protein n=1 Tax=candidate division WOR-3 bacterium TaxID=2052148 RepID=A0A7C4S1G1_UNCW3